MNSQDMGTLLLAITHSILFGLLVYRANCDPVSNELGLGLGAVEGRDERLFCP